MLRTLGRGTLPREVGVTIKRVEISGRAKRELRKVPAYVVDKLLASISRVEKVGVEEVRKIKGYHG